jgi:hypothetical protein
MLVRQEQTDITGGSDVGLSGYLVGLINTSGSINGLSDVDTVSTLPNKNEVLKWNGTNWVSAVYNASFTFAIATFTSTLGTTTVEIGTGTWKAIGSFTLSATYSNGPAISGYVTHTGWSTLYMGGVGFIGPTTNTEAVTYPAVGSTKVLTLHASDSETTVTSNLTYSFYNRRFWGVSSSTSLTESEIEALTNELSNSKAKTFTVTANTGEYIYFAYPLRLGTATFTVGGFEGGFESPTTVSVTNSSSYTENYYVYRSTNSGLGATTVVVV